MVEFPKIPTRFIFSGDESKARKLVGLGRKRFSDLTTALGFQGLETGFNTLKMSDGTIIKTTLNYGISTIEVYVPVPGEDQVGMEEYFDCLCFPCIAEGTITNVKKQSGAIICQGDEIADCVEDYSNEEMVKGLRYIYDVELCITSKKEESKDGLTIVLEGFEILSTGWERLEVGRDIFAMFVPDITVDIVGYECLYALISSDIYAELSRLIVVPVTLTDE